MSLLLSFNLRHTKWIKIVVAASLYKLPNVASRWKHTMRHHPLFTQLRSTIIWSRFVCQETWSSPEQNYYYTLCLLTLQFVIPLTVLIFTYTKIAIAVWGKRPPGEAENSRDRRMEKSKRKVSKKIHSGQDHQSLRLYM